ncbi:heat shock 70 kDa protein 12A-like [Mytilus edulis]|uniref:heat shock 70 kDa protein 12A-like n=1 Tax=Mytilus edulis TaxID=6550 RepID=UPI0039EECF0F
MSEDKIGWIITLPPLAHVETQQLMINAAIEAGISEEHLLVVTETDATVALCRSEIGMPTIQCGARVLILDLGSGSFDVCVYEVQDDQSLKIQLNSSCPAVGWPQIQDAFEEIFIDIVGNRVFRQYCNEHPEERKNWLEYLFRKICFGSEVQRKYMIIELPMDLLNVLYNETGKMFSELVCQSNLSDSLNCPTYDKLKISLPVLHKIFDIPIQEIKYHVNRVTEMERMGSLSNIIITGGIIQSEIIQLRIKQLFHDDDTNIIIPKDVGFAVLRGAIAIGMS